MSVTIIANRKSHTRFLLVPTSITLSDFEHRNSPYFAFFTDGEAPADKRFGAYLSQKGSSSGSNFCGVFFRKSICNFHYFLHEK